MAFSAFISTGITGWEVDYGLKVFRRASGSRILTQTLYSGLMNEFDDAAQMDDKIPMSAQTPTEYSLINGWHIPEDSMGYLYGGSIQTSGYDAANSNNPDPIYVLTASSFAVNFQLSDIGKVITDGTRTGTLLSYDNTAKKLWVRRAAAGTVTWSGTLSCTTTLAGGGTAIGTLSTAATGEDVWANFYTLGTYTTQVMYIYQNGTLITQYPGYTNGSLDQLIKTKSSGSTIDSGNVTIYCRESTFLYDNFTATASATGGRNPVPISVNTDTNDTGVAVAGVTVTFGTTSQDIGDGDGPQNYDVLVDGGGTKTCLEVYRYLKQIVGRTAANPGTFTTLTTGSGYFYRYANASYTEQKQAPFAQFAGGKIFGSRGIYITNVTDPNNRVLIDSANNPRTPPTTVLVTVTGVVTGDRVIVTRSTGTGSTLTRKNQFTTASGGANSGATTVVVNEAVGNDIPTTGVIRINDDRYTYSGLNRNTKTFSGISPALSQTYSTNTNTYVPLIDDVVPGAATSISGTPYVYVSNLDVVVRVRRYTAGAGNSIYPFENSGTIGNTNASFSAVRQIDPVAT